MKQTTTASRWWFSLLVSIAACGSSEASHPIENESETTPGGNDAAPPPATTTQTPAGAGGEGPTRATVDASTPEACAGQELATKQVRPNLLVVLDRSCSMTQPVADTTKWDVAVGSVLELLNQASSRIRFGLTLFPDTSGQSCEQGSVAVHIGPNKELAIHDLLKAALDEGDANYPSGPCDTNIDTAVEQAADEPDLSDPSRTGFVLLFTDGKQNGCDEAGGTAGAAKIIAKMRDDLGVGTFVVGFDSGIDALVMNELADAGGVPFVDAADPTKKYGSVGDPATMARVSAKAIGCTFHLEAPPPDPSKLFVFVNDAPEGIDPDPSHKNGWDYDAAENAVTFYGAACEEIEQGGVIDVDVVSDCDAPTLD